MTYFNFLSPFQFDLVCERGSLGFVSTSVIFLGFFIGGIGVSPISDKFGRRLPLFVCGALCSVFHFFSALVPAYWVFALFRAIVGFMIGKLFSRIQIGICLVLFSVYDREGRGDSAASFPSVTLRI